MSRSGYSDDLDNWELIRYRGQVASAIRGKRGQAFLRDLRQALDELPTKRLIPNALQIDGEYCALGALAHRRGIDIEIDDDDDVPARLAEQFGVAWQLAAEAMFMNDEAGFDDGSPEGRWRRVSRWVDTWLRN